MASVNFLYRSKKDKSLITIRLLFRNKNQDFVYAIKSNLVVEKSYWLNIHNAKRIKDIDLLNEQQRVKTELNKIETHILNNFCSTNINQIDKNWLKSQIEKYYNPSNVSLSIPTNLVDYIDYYIKDRINEIKPASITKFKVIKHKLQRMEQLLNNIILFKNIDDNFKSQFINYCKQNNYSNNTIQRELGLIKTFCRHARKKGIEVNNNYEYLNIKKEKVNHVYLTFNEIEIIEKLVLKDEYLDNARDWLIISCFCGQRISDFMSFTSDKIREENGKKLIEFTQKKTNKLMTIPLHPKILDILSKREFEFPRKISSQRYNEYIKEVSRIAGLNEIVQGKLQKNISVDPNIITMRNVSGNYKKWELVSSHIGRRSLASNFYGKIPTSFLIYMTGHSSEAMFLHYIGKSNKDIAIELTKYF